MTSYIFRNKSRLFGHEASPWIDLLVPMTCLHVIELQGYIKPLKNEGNMDSDFFATLDI